MRLSCLTTVILQAVLAISTKPTLINPKEAKDLDYTQLQTLASTAYDTTEQLATTGSLNSSTCSWENIQVRREWGNLNVSEKTKYINAVKCLQSKPSQTPRDLAPGAISRFDDFVATHINQTLTIHFTGNFLTWHRYFTWLYEQALRDECGYTGTQPYWDWPQSAITGLESSPVWDGSDTSMSGNGVYIANKSDIIISAPTGNSSGITIPSGSGGGCVYSGPFVNYTVNMGPVALAVPGTAVSVSNPNGSLAYNPRCLKRDLTDWITQTFNNATSVLSNIVDPIDVDAFQTQMQGIPTLGQLGIHGGGHYSMGGDPGRDLFVSPGDPAFYLHHSMIDRVYWLWQMQDPEARQWGPDALAGTITFNNSPESRNTTMDDMNEYGFAAGPPEKIGNLMSTISGPFCYVYA